LANKCTQKTIFYEMKESTYVIEINALYQPLIAIKLKWKDLFSLS